MARMADSEEILWNLTAEVQRSRSESKALRMVLAILLRRQHEPQTVITAEEMVEFSPETVLYSSNQPDGGLRLWVTP